MRQGMLALFFTLGLFVGPTYAQAPKEHPPAVEFELRVGNTNYDVGEGKTFWIVTPKGERVEVLLSRKKVLQFAAHGMSFNYDSSMKVDVETELGVVTVTVNSAASPMAMVQLYPAPATPDVVRSQLLQGLQEEFKSRGAQFLPDSGKTVKRQIRGMDREGQSLQFLLGGERMRMEVYAFQRGNTVMSVMLQHLEVDAELAKKSFSVITDSLQ